MSVFLTKIKLKSNFMKNLFFLFFFAFPFYNHAQHAKASNVFGDPNYFEAGVRVSELTDKKLNEISGMAASTVNPGLFWVQNDSGNRPEVYLVDEHLAIKFTVALKGVMNRDWEDIAVGPGPEPGKSYVYVADIGDNLGIFPTKMIYRFEEPVYDSTSETHQLDLRDFKRIIFRLPGGDVRDCESMLMDPISKNIYILSKEDSAILFRVRYPYAAKSDTSIADNLGKYSIPKITAGSVAKNGEEILLKNYRRVWYWKNVEHRPIEEVLKAKPIMIPYDPEPQGEAIAWAHDGVGFYTLSELKKDKKSFLFFYKRK